MKVQDIYHNMRAIAEGYHAYTDQLTAIAKWIEAEFEYKPQKLANDANTSGRQLAIPDVMQECFRAGHQQGYKDCQEMDNREKEGYEEWKRKHFA